MRRRKVLRACREAAGLTQAELARRSGINYSLLNRIETCLLRGTKVQREKIAAVLGMDETVIFPPNEDE